MDGLSPADWADLGSIVKMSLLCLGVLAIVHLLSRWRTKESLWRHGDGAEFATWSMFAMVLSLGPIKNLLERRGLPEWLSVVGLILLIFIVAGSAMRAMARQRMLNRVLAVDNPDSDGREMTCAVDLAPEDRKMRVRVNGAALAGGVLMVGTLIVAVWLLRGSGISGAGMIVLLTLAMLGFLTWLIKGRWPLPLTLTGEIQIDATPEQVWQLYHYRDTHDYYRSIVRRVEALDRPVETWRLHYYNDERCTDCGLHKNPVAPGRTCLVEVLEADRPGHMVTRSIPYLQSGELDPMMDHELSDMHYVALPDGGCRVMYVNTVARPRTWLALLLKMGDPIGEHLRDLKAHVEGGQGDTIYDRAERELDCARHVPQHCGCPPAMSGAPLPA